MWSGGGEEGERGKTPPPSLVFAVGLCTGGGGPAFGVRNRNVIRFVRERWYCDARLQTHSCFETSITIPPFANKQYEVSQCRR